MKMTPPTPRAFPAAWKAAVSSVTPSPVAPKSWCVGWAGVGCVCHNMAP